MDRAGVLAQIQGLPREPAGFAEQDAAARELHDLARYEWADHRITAEAQGLLARLAESRHITHSYAQMLRLGAGLGTDAQLARGLAVQALIRNDGRIADQLRSLRDARAATVTCRAGIATAEGP